MGQGHTELGTSSLVGQGLAGLCRRDEVDIDKYTGVQCDAGGE